MSQSNVLPLADWDAPQPLPQPARGSWTRFIVDYNPCFLLSAVCMLLGCRLLNDAVNARAGDARGALLLILTINVYEFCLLGVAALIRRSIGMRRDVGILLVTAAIFLCDIVFVAGDLSTARPGLGAVIAALLAIAAAGKMWIVLRLLDAPKRGRTIAVVAMQVGLIALLPVALKLISRQYDGYLPAKAIYASWWIAGLLPIVWTLVLRHRSAERLPNLARVFVVVPWVAMLGHLLACTWVFKLPYYAACYAPVSLGLAIVVGLHRQRFVRATAVELQWGLAALAVLLASSSPVELALSHAGRWSDMTALRLTLIGALIVNLHGYWAMRHPLFAVTLIAGLIAGLLGPTVRLMGGNLRELLRLIVTLGDRLIPRTSRGWGVAAVLASFLLLGAGAAMSLLHRKRPT